MFCRKRISSKISGRNEKNDKNAIYINDPEILKTTGIDNDLTENSNQYYNIPQTGRISSGDEKYEDVDRPEEKEYSSVEFNRSQELDQPNYQNQGNSAETNGLSNNFPAAYESLQIQNNKETSNVYLSI